MDIEKYSEYITNFVNLNPDTLLRFAFNSFDLSGTGEICEHDIFQIFEISKEHIPIQSFLNVLDSEYFYNDMVIA
jgi:Ca2+-binding EF-hand superfamily protein